MASSRDHSPSRVNSARRGSLVRQPYAVSVALPMMRYDIHGQERPTVMRRREKPNQMGGVICIGPAKVIEKPGPDMDKTFCPFHDEAGSLCQDCSAYTSVEHSDIIYGADKSRYAGHNMFRPTKVSQASFFQKDTKMNQTRRLVSAPPHKIPGDIKQAITSPVPSPGPHNGSSAQPQLTQPLIQGPPLRLPPAPASQTASSTIDVYEENHAIQLAKFFNQIYLHDQLTDIIIRVGSYTFSAHKTILCCFSPYLGKAIFASPNSKEILLGNLVTPTGFKKILDYMYTQEISIEIENLAEILQAARILEMPHLNVRCSDILKVAKRPALLDILETAHKQQIQHVLEEQVLSGICSNFSGIYNVTEFLELCIVCLNKILIRDDIVVENEYEVAKAAVSWIKFNMADRLDLLQPLINCIRLGNMSAKEIVQLGEESPFVMENERVRELLMKAHWCQNSKEVNVGSNMNLQPSKPRIYTADEQLEEDTPVKEATPAANDVSKEATSHKSHNHEKKSSVVKCATNNNNSFQSGTALNNNNCMTPRNNSESMFRDRRCRSATERSYSELNTFSDSSNSYLSTNNNSSLVTSNEHWPAVQGVKSEPVLGTNNKSASFDISATVAQTVYTNTVVLKKTGPCGFGPQRIPFTLEECDSLSVEHEAFVEKKQKQLFYFTAKTGEYTHSSVASLDIVSGEISRFEAKIPENVVGHAVVHIEPHVYVIGGSVIEHNGSGSLLEPSCRVWRIHTQSQTWEEFPSMKHCRYLGSAVVVKNKIYVFGGIDDQTVCLDSIEFLDLSKGRLAMNEFEQWAILFNKKCEPQQEWRTTDDPMPFPRCGAAACTNETTVFIAGGSSRINNLNDNSLRSSVLAYETTTDTWSRLTALNRPRFRASMACCHGALYICGGLSSIELRRYNNKVEMWSVRDQEWRWVATLPRSRVGARSYTDGNKLWVAGGRPVNNNAGDNDASDDVEVVDIL